MKKILIVREFDKFSRILTENGLDIINLPLIETKPLEDLREFEAKLKDITNCDGIFLTSKNAARILADKLRENNINYGGKVYVLGKSGFEILKDANLDLVFDETANTAEEMLEEIKPEELKDKRLLFVRGEKSLRVVPDFLADLAKVDEVIVYKTRKIAVKIDELNIIRKQFEKSEIAAVCFFSPSGAESFFEQFGAEILHQTKIATIGKTTADFFEQRNLQVDFISPKASAEDFAVELLKLLQMTEIKENKVKDTLIVGKHEIEGFINDSKTCPKCLQNQIYYDDYDSFFCPHCNIWLESACSDPTCEFCQSRTEKPLN